jgi:epoxyqueuosine reductase QueG
MQLASKDLKQKILESGADMAGICRAEALKSLPGYLQNPNGVMEDAKSVLIWGIRMLDASISCAHVNVRMAQQSTGTLYHELDRQSLVMASYLEDMGFKALPFPTHLPQPMVKETNGMLADVSYRHLAQEAGLGVFGKNNLILTSRFGPRIRFMALMTNAELTSDDKIEDDLCSDCMLCVEACPSKALEEEGKTDFGKCIRSLFKDGGSYGWTRFFLKLATLPEEERVALIKSPTFWEIWQSAMTGEFYSCFECVRVCPIGKKKGN